MNATLWVPLSAEQVRALISHHMEGAERSATTMRMYGASPSLETLRAEHLRAADDLHRRLQDFEQRTESVA